MAVRRTTRKQYAAMLRGCFPRPKADHSGSESESDSDPQIATYDHVRPSPGTVLHIMRWFPTEIAYQILADEGTLICPPLCALDLFVPEWRICRRVEGADGNGNGLSKVEREVRSLRVDTFTIHKEEKGSRGDEDQEAGKKEKKKKRHRTVSVRTTFDGCDHEIVLPVRIPPAGYEGGKGDGLDQEYEKCCVGDALLFADLGVPLSSSTRLTEETRRTAGDDEEGESGDPTSSKDWVRFELPSLDHPNNVDRLLAKRDLEGKKVVFDRVKHLMFHVPSSVLQAAAGIDNPGDADSTPEQQQQLVKKEILSQLRLRWDLMGRLRSLFLDLRGFSTDLLGAAEIYAAARTLCRLKNRGLDLLVIAGLRSGRKYRVDDGRMRMEEGQDDIQDDENCEKDGGDEGKDGEGEASEEDAPSARRWFRAFKGAMRSGGKMVFVDRAWIAAQTPVFHSVSDLLRLIGESSRQAVHSGQEVVDDEQGSTDGDYYSDVDGDGYDDDDDDGGDGGEDGDRDDDSRYEWLAARRERRGGGGGSGYRNNSSAHFHHRRQVHSPVSQEYNPINPGGNYIARAASGRGFRRGRRDVHVHRADDDFASSSTSSSSSLSLGRRRRDFNLSETIGIPRPRRAAAAAAVRRREAERVAATRARGSPGPPLRRSRRQRPRVDDADASSDADEDRPRRRRRDGSEAAGGRRRSPPRMRLRRTAAGAAAGADQGRGRLPRTDRAAEDRYRFRSPSLDREDAAASRPRHGCQNQRTATGDDGAARFNDSDASTLVDDSEDDEENSDYSEPRLVAVLRTEIRWYQHA